MKGLSRAFASCSGGAHGYINHQDAHSYIDSQIDLRLHSYLLRRFPCPMSPRLRSSCGDIFQLL